jgi:ABC-type polysaccharide/polyol phosphate export permease
VYLLSAQIIWLFFSGTTNQSMGEMIFSGGLLNRIYVPKAAFVVAAIGTGLVNLGFSLITLLIITLGTGIPFTWSLLVLPASVLLLSMFSMGIGLVLATAAVYFADIMPVYEVLLTVWMYATPIFYPISIIPPQYIPIFQFNPMYYLVELFRMPVYQGIVPGLDMWLIAGGFALASLLLGWYIFTSKSAEYAYRV